jgi:hypothetical protein
MTRIESATEHLHIAIESLVKAIAETCVNDGTMSFRDADKVASMTLAEAITEVGIKAFIKGVAAGVEQEQMKQLATY